MCSIPSMTTATLAAEAVAGITPIPLPDVKGNRAVLFLRLSDDELARGADVDEAALLKEVEKQRRQCRKLCKQRGLEVVGEYVEIDVSAYQPDTPRPGFEALLADAPHDVFDYVVAVTSDRIYRRLSSLTRITDELARYVRILPVVEAEVDLTTAGGILQAQIFGALGEFESRRKGERVKWRAENRAKDEGRSTSGKRPIGWTWADPCPRGDACEHRRRCKDGDRRPRYASRAGLVPDPVEGPLMVKSFELIDQGRSVRSVHRELWVGVGTCTRPETLSRALLCPRHAGLVAYGKDIVADAADGQSLVSVELWRRVKAILEDPTRRTNPGRPAKTYLSGILRCGVCQGPMNAGRNGYSLNREPYDAYVCSRAKHIIKRRDTLDDGVLELVGAYLVKNADRLRKQAQPGTSVAQTKAAAKVVELTNQLNKYAELAATMDPADYAAATRTIRDQLTKAQGLAVKTAGKPATARLLHVEDVAAEWASMLPKVEEVRAVLLELIDRVDVAPGLRGLAGVEVEWHGWAR